VERTEGNDNEQIEQGEAHMHQPSDF
jgi:hypothetical protein